MDLPGFHLPEHRAQSRALLESGGCVGLEFLAGTWLSYSHPSSMSLAPYRSADEDRWAGVRDPGPRLTEFLPPQVHGVG